MTAKVKIVQGSPTRDMGQVRPGRTMKGRNGGRDMPARELPRGLRLATIGVLAALATTVVRMLVENVLQPQSMDFLSFWAAGRLVVQGQAALAYDLAAHRAVQLSLLRFDDLLPFTYPPHMLALVAPLGLARYGVALTAWTLLGLAAWTLGTRRLGAGALPVASAAAFTNTLAGQNGFFLASLFVIAADLTTRRPLLAGLCWALFATKPQLAALVPFALLAGRCWTAFAAAALCYAALLAGAMLLFGAGIYGPFFASTARFAAWLQAGEWDWGTMTSVYALGRFAGLGHAPALAIHALIALAAAAAAMLAWRRDAACKVAVLAAASLLVSPYLFAYDALLLAVPVAWLATAPSARPNAAAAIWLPSFLLVARLAGLYSGPSPVAPLAALTILLCFDGERRARGPATDS